MSKEDLTLLKDEIFQKMRELEKKMNKESNEQKDEINLYYKRMDEKIEHILSNNREIIESVVSEKINYEKIHSLENFKNKADGILISHEIRINNHNKDINDMKTKYDKVIVDNLSVPGFIGNSCQYKNIGEYIVSTISEFSRFKYEKDTLKIETKELRTKIDNIFKKILSLVDNSIERCKDYANGKIEEYKKNFDTKFDEFGETALEIRLENSKTKTDIEKQVNNLKAETDKLLNMNEKLNQIDKNINKMNNLTDRFNYDINTLFEKNKNHNKLITNLKNDIAKTQKMVADIRTRNKKSKESKEKDNDKDKDAKKNKNAIKERKFDLSENKEENKIKTYKKRGTIFVHEDRAKLSDIYDSPKKLLYLSKSNKKNIMFENIVDKRKTMTDEQIKNKNKNIKDFVSKENIITNEIKEEKKNDCETSNNNDSSMNKESDEIENKNDNQDFVCENNNNIYYEISGNIQNNDNIDSNKEINNTADDNINDNIEDNIKNNLDNENDNDNDNNSSNNSINNNNSRENKNRESNKNNDYNLNLKKEIDKKMSKKEKSIKKEKKERLESKSISSKKDNKEKKENTEKQTIKNYEIKCDFDRNELLKNSLNLQSNNNMTYSNKNNNSYLNNNFPLNNENTNINLNKKNNILNKLESNIKKKSLKMAADNDRITETNIFPIINVNKQEMPLNDDNKNNPNIITQTEITDNNDSSNIDNDQNNKSNSEITSKINSNMNSNLNSNLTSNLNSNQTSMRNSLTKTNEIKNKKINSSKNNKNKCNANSLINNSKDKNFNYQINPQTNKNNIYPIISPPGTRMGVNYVGLNIDNINTQEDDDFDDIRLSLSGKKLQNLRLEGIGLGVSSPNSQKIERKKVRLQGISTEAPLKISAAFGRTAYTFINKNFEKNKLHNIKLVKRKKDVKKDNLDVFFAPNNK